MEYIQVESLEAKLRRVRGSMDYKHENFESSRSDLLQKTSVGDAQLTAFYNSNNNTLMMEINQTNGTGYFSSLEFEIDSEKKSLDALGLFVRDMRDYYVRMCKVKGFDPIQIVEIK